MKKKREKIEYKAFSFKLNNKTYEKLKILKLKSGKSWNLFIYNLIEKK